MTFNVGEIIAKYIDLRDRKAELAKKHDEEMRQFTAPMDTIENYLMHAMNLMGVSQLKESGVGTAFKAVSTSVQLKEPGEFKTFVFAPAIAAIVRHIQSLGVQLPEIEFEALANIIRDLPRWDIVELRAGKKGIQEYQEAGGSVPGVAINSIATISIRRA